MQLNVETCKGYLTRLGKQAYLKVQLSTPLAQFLKPLLTPARYCIYTWVLPVLSFIYRALLDAPVQLYVPPTPPPPHPKT